MDERKSVIETIRPADALGRLASRSRSSRPLVLAVAVVIFFGAVFLVGSIMYRVSQGTGSIELPSVNQ